MKIQLCLIFLVWIFIIHSEVHQGLLIALLKSGLDLDLYIHSALLRHFETLHNVPVQNGRQ